MASNTRARWWLPPQVCCTTPTIRKSRGWRNLGNLIHSARWDHSIPLDGKRIAIIGTGSTGVQIVSALASRAKVRHFQRTAQWIFPVENPAFSEEQRAEFRSNRDLLVYLQREPTYMANVERFTEGVLDPDSEQIQEIQKICQDNLDASVTDAALRQNCSPITVLVASV